VRILAVFLALTAFTVLWAWLGLAGVVGLALLLAGVAIMLEKVDLR
jgi:hypothetical protein